MSHKHLFSLGGHSVTSDIGGHSERDPIYTPHFRSDSAVVKLYSRSIA